MSSVKTGQPGRRAGTPAAPSAAPRAQADPAALALRLDQQVCFPLYAAAHLVTRLYRPLLAPLGLTYPQYLTMLVLWEGSPVSVGELGQRLLLDSGTLTPLLKRLETSGLVSRSRSPADERRVLIDLTPAGRKLQQRARAIPAAMCASLGVDARDLLPLRDALQRLVADLSGAQAQGASPPDSKAGAAARNG